MVTRLIKTRRLTLRKFRQKDLLAFHNNWANNPRVTKYLSWHPHEWLRDTKNALDVIISSYADGAYNWAIVPIVVGEPIGNISVLNEDDSTLEIAFCIGQSYWNRGYATEALGAVIEYLFNNGYQRIVCKHDVDNKAAGRVMMKCGMSLYGNEFQNNNQGRVLYSCYEIMNK